MPYTRMTELLLLQVTWNQVQGLASVESQLCSTLFGSFHANLCLYSMSPSSDNSMHVSEKTKIENSVCYLIGIPSVLQLANVARARSPVRTPAAANCAAIAANLRTVCHTDGGEGGFLYTIL